MSENKSGAITSCKDCVFAVYDGITQTGCQLNRIEKFGKEHGEVVEAFDHDREFYIIKGRICNAKRNLAWGAKNPGRDWQQMVEKDLMLQCDALVYISPDTTFHDIKKSVHCLANQELPPWSIVLVRNPKNKIRSTDLVDLMQDVCEEHEHKRRIRWRVEAIAPVDGETEGRCMDIAVRKCKAQYYMHVYAGEIIPNDYLEAVNHALNVECQRIIMVQPLSEETIHGLIVQTKAHRNVSGNRFTDVSTGIEEWVEDDEEEGADIKDMIKSSQSLLQQLRDCRQSQS